MTSATPLGPDQPSFLDGQLLVAMPNMGDTRFNRAVIYLCAHSAEGAMGIVLNHPARKVSFPELLVQLDVIGAEEAIRLPPRAGGVPVVKGGPVDETLIFDAVLDTKYDRALQKIGIGPGSLSTEAGHA